MPTFIQNLLTYKCVQPYDTYCSYIKNVLPLILINQFTNSKQLSLNTCCLTHIFKDQCDFYIPILTHHKLGLGLKIITNA